MPELKVEGEGGGAFFVGTEQAMNDIAQLRALAPKRLTTALKNFLSASGWRVHSQCTMIARKEARGVTNHYMDGFRNIGPNQDAEKSMYQQIISSSLYSLAIEYGARIRRMPPASVLDEWIRRVISPENPTDVRRISFAIRKAMRDRGRAGMYSQKFGRSSVPGGGKVMTMNRAVENSVEWMERKLEETVGMAMEKLIAEGEAKAQGGADGGDAPSSNYQADDQGNIVF